MRLLPARKPPTPPVRPARRTRRRRLLVLAAVPAFAGVLLGGWAVAPYWRVLGQWDALSERQPTRLYARAPLLALEAAHDEASVRRQLEAAGYAAVAGTAPRPGEFSSGPGRVVVRQRPFRTASGAEAGRDLVEILVRHGTIRALRRNGEEVARVVLEPPLLASFYGADHQERRPITLESAPLPLIEALIAAEDQNFFRHQGVSIRGIVRALIANLRGGQIEQGGSTITQQLVKNLYLTSERRLERKAREALLAMVLELRHDKRAILQAYLNEVYLGRTGRLHLHGVGAAAWAWFGKRTSDLDLLESATIIGAIPAPNTTTPLRHPEQARAARNRVLQAMAAAGKVPRADLAGLQAAPLRLSPQELDTDRARYAADAVAHEVAERFSLRSLPGRGFTIHTTLDFADQRAAEAAVEQELGRLESRPGRNRAAPLQAVLVSVDPEDGAILAYVGGRDYRTSQYDRARLARRQAGSAFKPIVYAAAFAQRVATPVDRLEDSPIEVAYAGQTWRPQNDDGEYRGMVSVRSALEHSRNVPTVELALRVGLPEVIAWAEKLGIQSPLRPLPSLALGALEVVPLELLRVYATFAAGGVRPHLHLVEGVTDAAGKALPGAAVPGGERVIGEAEVYLVTSLLEGTITRGTGQAARGLGLHDALAGKTGTTNGGRDSWFVGYARNRATLAWVGYDDAAATRLSGSRAALPVWTRFMIAVRPSVGYPLALPPAGTTTLLVDPLTGERATAVCPRTETEVFLADQAPLVACRLHGAWVPRWQEAPERPRFSRRMPPVEGERERAQRRQRPRRSTRQ